MKTGSNENIAGLLKRWGLACLLMLCAGCGAVGGSATTGGASGEAGLFDEGPVDLPVTIAKLESPNPEYIDVTVNDGGVNLVRELDSPWLSADTTYPVTFTGRGSATDIAERAVRNPEVTPYVLVKDTVVPVAADGSFSAVIEATVEEDIPVLALTDDDLGAASASPAVIFSIDELGTVTVTVTNSSRINNTMPFASDPYGNILFSITEDDGSYTLWRRNVDGSLPDVVLQSNPEEFLHVAAMDDVGGHLGMDYTAIVMDGGVNLTKVVETDAGFTPSPFAESIGYFSDIDNISSQRYYMETADINKVLVMRQVDFRDPGQTEAVYTKVMEVYWTDGSQVATIIGIEDENGERRNIRHMKVAFNHSRTYLYVAIMNVERTATSIYRLPHANQMQKSQYELAWAARETVIEDWPYQLQAMKPDVNGNLVVLAHNVDARRAEIGVINTTTHTYDFIVDAGASGYSPYSWITAGGRNDHMAMICGTRNLTGVAEYRLSVVRLDVDNPTFVDFSSSTKLRTCHHIKPDHAGRLHFFTSAGPDEPSQMSFINLETNEILRMLDQ